MRAIAAGLVTCTLLVGCAHAPKEPPPLQHIELAGSRAAYRAYPPGSRQVCDAEPRWLADELAGVNALLGRFLRATGQDPDAEWSQDQLETLKLGSQLLPPVLEQHARNLKLAKDCGFGRQAVFKDVLEAGADYVQQGKARLEHASELVAYLEGKKAREEWKTKLHDEQAEYRSFCEGRKPQVFFAYQGEDGATRFLFCDDARVKLTPGSEKPEVSPPPVQTIKEARRWKEAPYLQKVHEYPKSEIRVPPPLPAPPPTITRR